MSYLIRNDYNRLIQDVTLQQIISGNDVLVSLTEQSALAEIISYLVQKYDISKEFTDTTIYNPSAIYKAANRVYLDAPIYDQTRTYPINSLVIQNSISLGDGIYAYTGKSDTILFRTDLWLISDQTLNFLSNQNVYHNPTLKNWVYEVELQGVGTLHPGIDISFLPEGGFDWINGYIIQTGEKYILHFQSQVTLENLGYGIQSNQVYLCSSAITIPETFNPDHWTLLGNQYDIYYALKPASDFNLQAVYSKGNIVFYKDHTYTALQSTISYDHSSLIQFNNTDNIPYQNIFPDDPIQGLNYWHDNGAYTITPGNISDITKFAFGDNRNQQMIEYMMDIVIYKLYKRVSPKEIPQQREDAYSVALGWLKQAAKGTDITADLPRFQPPTGRRIRYEGNVKQINSY
jgi:hypothetical protein